MRILLSILVLVGVSLPAKAAVLTLSCDGTMLSGFSGDIKEPITITKMGLIVDLDAHVVTGFGTIVATIDKINANFVSFKGAEGNWDIFGSIDRITGGVGATKSLVINNELCSPTKPLF